MIDPPGDGNPPEQFRGETSRDIYAWIQEARLFIEGTKTFNRDALYVRGAILLRAMRGDGLTTGADSAGSGARGTLDGRTRDPEALIANHEPAASSADPLPSQPYDLRTLEYIHNEWEFADMTEPEFDDFLHRLIQHARLAQVIGGTASTLDRVIDASAPLPSERDPRIVIAAERAAESVRWDGHGRADQVDDLKVSLRDLLAIITGLKAALAAADPALRTLSAKWRRWASKIRPEEDRRQDGFYTKREWLEMCAADLDRLCPALDEKSK